MDDEIKSNILTRRREILSKVKQKIDDVLNPSKPTYDPHATSINILNEIDIITEQDYQWALSISPDSDHELHLKRPMDSCFTNNYFIAGLKGFAANVDLQPVFNHYNDRPKNVPVVNDSMCLALFAAHYFKDYKSDFNEVSDSQPEVLSDDFIESQNIENHNTGLPDRIKLVNSKEIIKCRKIKAVIRYHTPNKRKEPEKYFHHLLMLYFPWRNEQELFDEDQTYISKFYEPDVQEVVQRNKEIFEPDGDAINEALESLRNFDGVPTYSYDPINDQENEDLRQSLPDDSDETESFNESLPQHLASNPESVQPSSGISSYNQPLEISDDDLRKTVRSLNNKQRQYAYDVVLSWCRNKMANLNTLKPSKVDPIYVFVTGGGGAGKSH
ncbi:Hypothetical predicted protein [Paramuricea clavata]|uniref:Uncharacterized protein n=1 Tax=Paramuricea clavata TaxID=317549 RepID=A0A7D9I5C6_PARCT|nr:Hypothetical predicted protein [Paramuricea clavata]